MKTDPHQSLLATLQKRFDQHPERHPGCHWNDVEKRLNANPAKLHSLHAMEQSGGEPDVTGYEASSGEFIFTDCAPESPAGRRSACYDQQALDARKEAKPKHSAVELAASMGATLLTEAQYRELQELGPFDLKTSSWLDTPEDIRQLGGAIFGDLRYGRVFVYHNGAQSYYAARGLRCRLRV